MTPADHANTVRQALLSGQFGHIEAALAALDALQAQAEMLYRINQKQIDLVQAAEAERDAAVRAGEKLLAYWEPPPRGTREYDFWEPPDGKTTRRILAEFRAALSGEDT